MRLKGEEREQEGGREFSAACYQNQKLRMSELRRRWSFSFAIGLALFLVCMVYIPQWQTYAPRIEGAIPHSPYLTPWTVLFVSVLSLSLAIIALPTRIASPLQTVVSKTLGVVVLCFATIFLLEYVSGIRMPDLDIFFLPDAVGQHVTLYSARPCSESALTSLFFALALLFYNRDQRWRLRTFQIGTLAALIFPTLAALGYIIRFLLADQQPSWLWIGLSIPTVILYFTLGSGFFGLCFSSHQARPTVARAGEDLRRFV
jgi:hypothetical protein